MFPRSYFPGNYFPPRYFPSGASTVVVDQIAALDGRLALAPIAAGALELQPLIFGTMTLEATVDGSIDTGVS